MTQNQDGTIRLSGAGQAAGFVVRVFLMVMGAALTLSAFGLWLLPGATGAPALSLMKLGVSLFLLIAGLCCIVIGRPAR